MAGTVAAYLQLSLTHAGPQARPFTVPWEKPQGSRGSQAGKRCSWAITKLLAYSSGIHSELSNHPKLQLVHSSLCKKAKATPAVFVFCRPWEQEAYQGLNTGHSII